MLYLFSLSVMIICVIYKSDHRSICIPYKKKKFCITKFAKWKVIFYSIIHLYALFKSTQLICYRLMLGVNALNNSKTYLLPHLIGHRIYTVDSKFNKRN